MYSIQRRITLPLASVALELGPPSAEGFCLLRRFARIFV